MALSGDVKSLVQASNGHVLAGTNNSARIYRSTDNGQTWTQIIALGSSTDSVNALFRDKNTGYIFAAVSGGATAQGIWRSLDHGASWAKVKAHPGGAGYGYLDITAPQGGGRLIAVGFPTTVSASPIITSSNSGTTWLDVSTPAYNQRHMAIAAYNDPVLFSLYPGESYGQFSFIGTDSYYTAQYGVNLVTGGGGNLVGFGTVGGGAGNGGLDMASFLFKDNTNQYRRRALWAVKSHLNVANTEIWQYPATPSSFSFAKIVTITGKLFNTLYVDPIFVWQNIGLDRTIWAGANGEIWVSYNSGLAWSVATTAPTGQIYSFVRTTDNILIAGGASGEIFIFGGTGGEGGGGTEPDPDPGPGPDPTPPSVATSRFLGRSATCDNEVFVANKFSFSQITHAFYYNGSTFDNFQFEDEPPYNFLGTGTPTTSRIAYFGSLTGDTNVPGGPFSGVVFDLTTIGNDLTILWEYWNGSAWATIPSYVDGTDNFKLPGVRSVHWRIPSGWATTAVNSITGYWVRARISAVGSSPVAPIQGNRYIYTPSLPYIEVAAGEVSGDLPALARYYWHNRAENDSGAIGTKIDRMIAGLKSIEKGVDFNAYLNISDVQTPFGISLAVGTGATWGNQVTAPTGRALTVTYSSGGDLNVWNDLVTFTLNNTVARGYYGSYRVFVRCTKAGAIQDWQIRVKTAFGSGGGSSFSQTRYATSAGTWEVIDLGQMAIPTIQVAQQQATAQQISITVQGKASQTSSAMTFFDLILIPVDEWAIDAKAATLATTNAGKVIGNQFLDIDSITNPKGLISALNRNSASQIVSQFQAINNGPAILQTGQQQRLWMLAMNYNNYWTGIPEIAGSVQVFKKQRYLGFRGTS